MQFCSATCSIFIEERSHVATARRRGIRLARNHGFSEEARGRLAIVVSEAAANILDHAEKGELLVSATRDDEGPCIDVLAVDRGPGIIQLHRALAGGRSTKKGLGEGLGAMQRLADRFEIFAPPGGGTTVGCRLFAEKRNEEDGPPSSDFQLGAVTRPKRGEIGCGDQWGFRHFGGGGGLLLVTDGLGHGPMAQEASIRAIETLRDFRLPDPVALLAKVDTNLAGTRGAAAMAIFFDPSSSEITVCGIGNISGTTVVSGARRGLVSLDGTLGANADLQYRPFVYPWPEGSLLLVHSDGLSSRWDLGDYPGLVMRHPALIVGALYRDHNYGHDDSTLVVVRRPKAFDSRPAR